MDIVSSLKDAVLNVAFPQACHICRARVRHSSDGVACFDCWSQTKFVEGSPAQCLKCGIPAGGKFVSTDCPACCDHHYDLARSLGAYEKALSASILHLKRIPVIPVRLIERFPDMLFSDEFAGVETIVPVPLSRSRYVDRGFNQAEVVAAAVAKVLRIRLDAASLVRKKHTPMHRAAMDKKAREMTVKNAFEVIRPKLIEGRSILLVDDIFTTGATASYCAKALKKKGAASVKVFTLARAL